MPGLYPLEVPDHLVDEGSNRVVLLSDMEHFRIERLLDLAVLSLESRLDRLRNASGAFAKPPANPPALPDIEGVINRGDVPLYREDLQAIVTAAGERLAEAQTLRDIFKRKSFYHSRETAEDVA